MKLINVGLFVKDLEGARTFFEEYFQAQVVNQYFEDDGYQSYIMQSEGMPKIELMTKPEIVDQPKDRNRTGYAHLCIDVETKENFDRILKKVEEDGYEILSGPEPMAGGREFRAKLFEDNVMEIFYM